ncbi:MAG: hypothetical protein CVT92_16520 [Bacteroidetes bacterium HGW-Bacteroidetes-1]|jgi:hypothetical protein|nr:MAG: hypothetical protein CVT92_16520 [Bacteroidetes bacterium HGW-Bacteroidetes-1]
MKKVLIVFLIMNMPFCSQSQSSWLKLFQTTENEYFGDLYELKNGNLILGYSQSDPKIGVMNKIAITKQLNPYGEEISEQRLEIENRQILLQGVIEDHGNQYSSLFIFYNQISGNSLNSGIRIEKYDGSNVSYNFPGDYDLWALGKTEIYTDKIILTGSYRKPGYTNYTPFFQTLNKEFDSISYIEIPEDQSDGSYQYFKQITGNKFWAFNMFRRRLEYLDDKFNVIGKYPLDPFYSYSFGFKWDSDSTFYYTCKDMRLPKPYTIAFNKQTHLFDTTNTLRNHWHISDTIDFTAFRQSIDFRTKDTILIGFTRNINIQNPYYAQQPSWLVVLQTDSLLNLRWERFYGGDAYYVMSNLISTQDGGCLIGGWRFDYQNSTEDQTDVFLLKLNSEGLLTGQVEMPEFQMREAIVYPNPGRQLHIRLAMQHPKAQLQLFDQAGRLVLQQQLHQTESTVETAHLSSGVYLYHLTAPTGLYESGKWVKE